MFSERYVRSRTIANVRTKPNNCQLLHLYRIQRYNALHSPVARNAATSTRCAMEGAALVFAGIIIGMMMMLQLKK